MRTDLSKLVKSLTEGQRYLIWDIVHDNLSSGGSDTGLLNFYSILCGQVTNRDDWQESGMKAAIESGIAEADPHQDAGGIPTLQQFRKMFMDSLDRKFQPEPSNQAADEATEPKAKAQTNES